jgi:hypothetical protein
MTTGQMACYRTGQLINSQQRYSSRWKAAIVFNGSAARPIYQTITHDLSMNGASLQSDTDEKIGSVISLLLRPPPIDGVAQRIVKLEAVVMSSMPFRGCFRLGIRFVEDPELEKLCEILRQFDLSGESLPSDPQEHGLPKLL